MLQEDTSSRPSKENKSVLPEEVTALFSLFDTVAENKSCEPLPQYLDVITRALRLIAAKTDIKTAMLLRSDPHFQKLGLISITSIPNFTDRQLHSKIAAYFTALGLAPVLSSAEVHNYFAEKDRQEKQKVLASYAEHGLVSLKTAVDKGILQETSATPGDFVSVADLRSENLSAEHQNVRGYLLNSSPVDKNLFYGRNSFFKIVLERSGESIDRASQIDKVEVENRLRNSVLFGVKEPHLVASRVTDPDIKSEYIVGKDILPSEIEYVLVDKTNVGLAELAFKNLPAKVIGVDQISQQLENLYEGPYLLPNFEDEVNLLVKTDGPIWCHVARLKVDTYP